MAQKIISVSVSKEEEQFIFDNNISPTRLLRNRIQEMMEFQKNGLNNKEAYAKIERMQEIITGYTSFLEKRGLIDEFLEKENKL